MSFSLSLTQEKVRRIFAVSFCLSFLLPVLVLLLVLVRYVYPVLEPGQISALVTIFNGTVLVLGLVPALGFLLVRNWIVSFEDATEEIQNRMDTVSGREKITPLETEKNGVRGQEIQNLIDSFNILFQSTTDSEVEKEHLKELLSALIALSADLTAELDFDRLFPLIISKVTEVMNAERTSLYIIDWEREELWTKVAEGLEPFRVPLGSGISGHVAKTGEPLNIRDAWKWPDFDRSYDERHNYRTRAVLCLPLTSRTGERIGVLQVLNKQGTRDYFNQEDEIFLQGLRSQVGIALENSLLHDELRLSFESSLATLSAVVDARHPFTAGHSLRVREYSLMIAEEMDLPQEEKEVLKVAAQLHDIGKIGIRDGVLLKNGIFGAQERAEMETHALHTKRILEKFRFPKVLEKVPEVAAYHHERINGEGYPFGLTGDQLPLGSKIVAVADVFDALTSKRDYPKYTMDGTELECERMPLSMAVEILEEGAGVQFDAEVVAAFKQCLPRISKLSRAEREPVSPEEELFGQIYSARQKKSNKVVDET